MIDSPTSSLLLLSVFHKGGNWDECGEEEEEGKGEIEGFNFFAHNMWDTGGSVVSQKIDIFAISWYPFLIFLFCYGKAECHRGLTDVKSPFLSPFFFPDTRTNVTGLGFIHLQTNAVKKENFELPPSIAFYLQFEWQILRFWQPFGPYV